MLSWGRSSSREGRPSSEERSASSSAGGDVATRHAVRQRMDAIAGEDDDIGAWNDGSEDEQEVVKTVKGLSKLDVNVSSPSSTGATEQQRTARPATQQRSSSWSFNPFSIISGSPKTPVAAESSTAAALEQAAKRATARRQDSSSGSIPSSRHAPRASTSKLIVEEPAPRKASVEMRELWKAAIRQDVDDIVRDPVTLLSRYSPDVIPIAPPTSENRRSSISSLATSESGGQATGSAKGGDESDEDEASAGYVKLDATNISSSGPQIVEFGRVDAEPEETGEQLREKRRRKRFFDVLGAEDVDLAELRKLAWSGVPAELRPIAWQLLLGYLPAPSSRRAATLARKRQEYADAVRLAFSRGTKSLDGPIWHQISIDVPRTNAGIRLWQCETTQRSLERILYVWAIRHPASGYVQGINDLVTPFFYVFLTSYIEWEPEDFDTAELPANVLQAIEADSFWCLSKLLDGIQDNYIYAQPGIQRQVKRMKELCTRVDAPLAQHLEENGVDFIQFAFRWMNCLLMREMNIRNIIRMWDTYLAEGGDAFSEFHMYVCLAFLIRWSDQLRSMDFQSMIIFLQALPTQDWTDKHTELLLSEAFMWSQTFSGHSFS